MAKKPLRLVQANLGGANGWSQDRCIAILKRACERADVVFFCEAAPITADNAGLDSKVWAVLHDPSSAARAGSGLAVRRTRVTIGWHALRRYSVAGSGIRARYSHVARICVDGAYFLKVVSGHTPPKRAWTTVAPMWWASARLANADIYGADFNRLSGFVSRALSRATRMVGIVGFALRKALPASPVARFDVGSDHPAVQTVLYP